MNKKGTFLNSFGLPIGVGMVCNLAGADMSTAAIISGGLAGVQGIIGTGIAASEATLKKLNKKATNIIACTGVALSIAAAGISGAASCGAYKLTDMVLDNVAQRAAEQTVETK